MTHVPQPPAPLFDHLNQSVPFQRHSRASRDGARSIRSRVKSLKAHVLDYLVQIGPYGATDEEIHRDLTRLGRIPVLTKDSTVRARRIDLVREGLVVDSKNERRTAAGVTAAVWVVASASSPTE